MSEILDTKVEKKIVIRKIVNIPILLFSISIPGTANYNDHRNYITDRKYVSCIFKCQDQRKSQKLSLHLSGNEKKYWVFGLTIVIMCRNKKKCHGIKIDGTDHHTNT